MMTFEAVLGNKEFELVVFGVTFAVVTKLLLDCIHHIFFAEVQMACAKRWSGVLETPSWSGVLKTPSRQSCY
jgi:hypothetical protein